LNFVEDDMFSTYISLPPVPSYFAVTMLFQEDGDALDNVAY